MKKFWQQINRGLVLLFAVVIGVTIYLIVDSQNKKKQRDELIKLSTMFISDSSRLYEFPEDIDFWDRSNIKQDALLPALYQNATPIYHYFCDNEEARKSQIE